MIVSKIVESLQCILKENKLGTLHGFVIFIHDMQFPTWTSALSHKIIEKMCIAAAKSLQLLLGGREYGFAGEQKECARNFIILNKFDLTGLPTNNLITERDLPRLDSESQVTCCHNRRLKAKNI